MCDDLKVIPETLHFADINKDGIVTYSSYRKIIEVNGTRTIHEQQIFNEYQIAVHTYYNLLTNWYKKLLHITLH
jgi:hypothetical protein